jgi:hypothetical protein
MAIRWHDGLSRIVDIERLGKQHFLLSGMIWLGEQLPKAAFAAMSILIAVCCKCIVTLESNQTQVQTSTSHTYCRVPRQSVVHESLLLLICLAVCLTVLKQYVFPRLVLPEQFSKSIDLEKYYGFASQVSYHCVVVCGLLIVLMLGSGRFYRLLTLAEPAYCTFDVLLFVFTGVSFTNWQVKPLLVHHMISCACTHALVYGIPCSVSGMWLQLVLHGSSAICLGIANVVCTPSFRLKPIDKVCLNLVALFVFGSVRIGLILVLGACTIWETQRLAPPHQRRLVTTELAVAAAASMIFVVIKTPILVDGLRKAVLQYEQEEEEERSSSDQQLQTEVSEKPQSKMHKCSHTLPEVEFSSECAGDCNTRVIRRRRSISMEPERGERKIAQRGRKKSVNYLQDQQRRYATVGEGLSTQLKHVLLEKLSKDNQGNGISSQLPVTLPSAEKQF